MVEPADVPIVSPGGERVTDELAPSSETPLRASVYRYALLPARSYNNYAVQKRPDDLIDYVQQGTSSSVL